MQVTLRVNGTARQVDVAPERQPYRVPEVEVFRDMAQLLALDPPMPDVGDIPWRRADERSHD